MNQTGKIEDGHCHERDAANSQGNVGGRYYQQTDGVLIASIARMMRTYFDRRAREIGLTRSQWQTMNRLSLTKGITVGMLAELMEVEQITASRLVGNLESMGWAVRKVGAGDRRQRLVYLTEKGLPVLQEINSLGAATEEELFDGLTEHERIQLGELLRKVHATLTVLTSKTED